MLTGKTLENFALLSLQIGVNIQPGQGLEIACPVTKREIAHALTKKAYELGAKIVRVRWEDDETDRLNYTYAEQDALCDIPKWLVACKNFLVEKNFCYVAISAEDPSAFKDISAEKLANVAKARSKALKKFSDAVMANEIRWCVISVPTYEWAKQVFPHSSNPEEELSVAIEKTMRLNLPDPIQAWREHIQILNDRANFLNEQNFSYLHYTNSLGTDFKVGLADGHQWLSAQEVAQDGVRFVANMPTEEVFTAPHRLKAEGIIKSSMPLSYNGQIIQNFSIKFKNGKVVDFYAEKGHDVLKHLIETDAGTYRLGEVALIGKRSPVAECGILFYNTLFDENASCHFALGKAYPTTVKNGNAYTLEQLKKLGVNDSVEHVDFMIGTDDLNVVGIKQDGSTVPIFSDGDWVI